MLVATRPRFLPWLPVHLTWWLTDDIWEAGSEPHALCIMQSGHLSPTEPPDSGLLPSISQAKNTTGYLF